MNGILFALLAPLGWSSSNMVDKYILEHRVKNTLSYSAVAGIVTFSLGLILAFFLHWNIDMHYLYLPIFAGIFMGLYIYSYYLILEKDDITYLMGFLYLYPVIVVLLSFFLLNEIISFLGYTGVTLTVIGIILLSLRSVKMNFSSKWWLVAISIIFVSLWAFFVKLSTAHIPEWNGVAIQGMTEGIMLMLILFHAKSRRGFKYETRNLRWSLLSEIFNYVGFTSAFFAFALLPATIAVAITSVQPVLVLFLERIIDGLGGNISKDELLLPKLLPITLITLGVIFLSIAGA